MTDIRMKISPPWITYVNEINCLFEHDPEVQLVYDNDEKTVELYVEDPTKAFAIDRLLPDEVEYGNIVLEVKVTPGNKVPSEEIPDNPTNDWLFNTAFKNSPVFAYTKTITGLFSNDLTYVVFKNRVVQFFNDNLNDIHGLVSTLYQEIANDVFSDELNGVCYCTDIEERVLGTPLGEWP